jgi:uncharacterized integral membrane protein
VPFCANCLVGRLTLSANEKILEKIMASPKKEQQRSNRYWIAGIVVSILMLTLFLFLQQNNSQVLNLDVKWLVVASIPLILVILRSNKIKKFKGFGIELETRLQESVGKINLVAVDALTDLPSDEKRSRSYLENLPEAKRIQTQRLTIREGRNGYYQPEAIHEYLRRLPNIKYFEVLSSEGKFVALIPIELFRMGEYTDIDRLNHLVESVAEKETLGFFPHSIITDTVLESENLIEALLLVRKSQYGLLPVISGGGNLLGVVTRELIESKIADEVIASQDAE